LKELEEVGGWGVDIREKTVGCWNCRVFAADKGFDLWAAGACDDGVVACKNCSIVSMKRRV